MPRFLRWCPSAVVLAIALLGCTRSDPEAPGQGSETTPAVASGREQTAKPAPPAEPPPVSFSRQVAPIFAGKCNDCHHAGSAVKVALTDVFDPEIGLINRPNSWTRSEKTILVVPGDPDASALVWKVEQTQLELKVDGDPMPWSIPRLTETELESLRKWIADGARDDSFYRGTVARIFGDGVSLGSRGGKCAYCHHPGAAYGPDLTDVFDSERGAVGVAAVRGGVRVVPGDPEASVLYLRTHPTLMPQSLGPLMPKHFPRLTDGEIALIRTWIAEGARDN